MENTRAPRKILRSPSVKRKNKVLPVNQRVQLERVLGLTGTSNAGLSCDSNSGAIAYPAGCVTVLFNPRRNKQSHIFNAHKKAVTAVAFSPDGKHLVTGETGHQPAVRVWDVAEKTQVAEFHGHKFGVNCVAFSPNSKEVVSVGTQHDMMINVWNWRTGIKVASNKVSSKVSALAFSEDGKCFATVGNRHVRFWYLEDRRSKINQTVPLMGRNGILGDQKDNFFCDVVAGQGSMSGRFFVITQSGLLCEFNEKRLLDKWVELMTKTASCITAGEEHIFVGCAEGVVRVFSATTLHYVCTLPPPHPLGVEVTTATSPSHLVSNRQDCSYPDTKAIAMDDDHKKVTCVYSDRSMYIWDVHDLKRVGKAWSFLFHSGCIWALEMYPQLEEDSKPVLPPGSFLTASGDNTIRVWNLNTHMPENTAYKRNIYSNELLKIVYADPSLGSLCNVDYNPAGATDKTDTTYDGKNGVRSIRVSPDGAHLASGDRQGNIRIYDMEYLTEQKCVEAHESDVMCLEYSYTKEGRLLATSSRDRLIHVFDVEANYGLIQTLADHSSSITAVRFMDKDDKLSMVSCGADKSILLRNAVASPDLQFQLEHHLATKITLYDMVIDPTQKLMATACQDRNVRLYNIQTTKEKKCYRGSAGDEGVLLRIHLDPSGSFAATSCTDKNVCILDFNSGELLATMHGHSEVITGVKFANDLKHIITVSADGCIFVWRLPKEMTLQIKSRLLELGKKLKDTDFLRCDEPLMPNPVLINTSSVDGSFHVSKSASLSFLPRGDEDLFDGRSESYDDGEDDDEDEEEDEAFDDASTAGVSFSPGPLPSWAKAKFGDNTSKANDSGQEHAQPKGRWAQRVDHTVEFKSQLDLTQSEEDSLQADRRRPPAVDKSDPRRETFILPAKNVSSLSQDLRGSTGDLRTSLKTSAPQAPKSLETPKRREANFFKSDTSLNTSGSGGRKRWSERFDMVGRSSLDHEDTDELDTGSDTTEIIYLPTESDLDPSPSSYKVFAVENVRKSTAKTNVGNLFQQDDASESTDPISLEDEDDANDETLISSAPTTPSDPEKPFLDGTSDKEDFVRENFEDDTFSKIPLEKFLESTEALEQQVLGGGSGAGTAVSTPSAPRLAGFESSAPFSPRLSLSARFMSRAGPSVFKNSLSSYVTNRQDNWFNRNKMEMSRAMDETRKSLLAMNTRNDLIGSNSPEKEDPPSPPTKLEEISEMMKDGCASGQYGTSPPSVRGVDGCLKSSLKDSLQQKPVRTSVGLVSPVKQPGSLISSPAARRINQERERRRSSTSKPVDDSAHEEMREASSGPSTSTSGSGTLPRRTRPSYFKPTQSSKNKTSRTSGDGQEAPLPGRRITPVFGSGGPAAGSSGSGSGGGGLNKLSSRMKLSSSKVAQYASTPNLMSSLDDEEDEEATNADERKEIQRRQNRPKVTHLKFTSTTNLRLLSDLSRSVPDVNDESSSTDSNSTGSGGGGAIRLSNLGKTFPTLASSAGAKKLPQQPTKSTHLPYNKQTVMDQTSTQPPRRKTSASEMTLDQAKSILLGKSGLLPSKVTPTSDSGAGTSVRGSTSPESMPSSLASTMTGGSPPRFDLASATSTQRALVQDIEQTANSLRQQRHLQSSYSPQSQQLSNLEASPQDLPERDQPANSQRRLTPKSLSISLNSGSASNPLQTFHHQQTDRVPSTDSTFLVQGNQISSSSHNANGVDSEYEEETGVSVRERIAQFLNPRTVMSNVDLDKSRLSLPLNKEPQTTSSSVSVAQCQAMIDDFHYKLDSLKNVFHQMEGRTDDNSCQIMSLLGAAFQQGHKLIADLASKAPSPPETGGSLSQHPNIREPSVSTLSRQPPCSATYSTSSSAIPSSSLSSFKGAQEKPFHSKAAMQQSNGVGGENLSSSHKVSNSLAQRSQDLMSSSHLTEAVKAMLEPLLSNLSSDLAQEILKFIQDGNGKVNHQSSQ